jgi:hypothetical protein
VVSQLDPPSSSPVARKIFHTDDSKRVLCDFDEALPRASRDTEPVISLDFDAVSLDRRQPAAKQAHQLRQRKVADPEHARQVIRRESATRFEIEHFGRADARPGGEREGRSERLADRDASLIGRGRD